MRWNIVLPALFLTLATVVPLASAKVPEEQAKRLGKDLTPLGAEVAGEGDVPAWTGGLTEVPDEIAFDPAVQHPPNPFPDDEVSYTITRKNMAQYDAQLTDGHKAMLKRLPSFKMNVYPSRRSCTVPEFVQEATKSNATEVELTADGEGVTGGSIGIPFPIPQSAKELMWNHRLRYVPYKTVRYLATAPVRADGTYDLITHKDRRITFWSDPQKRALNLHFLDVRKFYTPPRLTGVMVLIRETTNSAVEPSVTWWYNPAVRRVRRFPPAAYDVEAFNVDGLSTVDSATGFSGALDRYDWEIRGRSVRLVPYNSYDALHAKYGDLIKPENLNPDLVRYEPHRVWVVDAKLREGQKHLYDRRTLYLDEDTQAIVAGELYDGRGNLWRVQEIHTINFYHLPACLPIAELVYDLESKGRYLAASLSNEEKPLNPKADDLKESCFVPEMLGLQYLCDRY